MTLEHEETIVAYVSSVFRGETAYMPTRLSAMIKYAITEARRGALEDAAKVADAIVSECTYEPTPGTTRTTEAGFFALKIGERIRALLPPMTP